MGETETAANSLIHGSKRGFHYCESAYVDGKYMDGTKEKVTGEAGVSSTGPIIFSDLFVGEKYDARKEMPGWDCAGFDDSGWEKVIPMKSGKGNEGNEKEATTTMRLGASESGCINIWAG